MSKLVYFLLVSLMVGCQSSSTLSDNSYPVEIMIVSSSRDGHVRITYRDHHVLHTIYVEGEPCRYDVGPSELITVGENVLLIPNRQC